MFYFKKVKELVRVFPYAHYLVTVFPVYAILLQQNIFISGLSLFYIFPFVIMMASGFAYNTISDVLEDPPEKNIIRKGDLSLKESYIIMILTLAFSLCSFLYIYKSAYSCLFFVFYIFLWLSYSGANIRFKESYLGPVVASIVLWVGPPITLAIEFNILFNTEVFYFFLGLFFVYISSEIRHTLGDYQVDLSYNCKTFAVLLGENNARIADFIFLLIGYLLLIISYYLYNPNLIVFSIFFTILLFFIGRYMTTLMFILAYSCALLKFSWILIFFITWISLVSAMQGLKTIRVDEFKKLISSFLKIWSNLYLE
jgi:4-hydroxybenzoate polyprenyltransferase